MGHGVIGTLSTLIKHLRQIKHATSGSGSLRPVPAVCAKLGRRFFAKGEFRATFLTFFVCRVVEKCLQTLLH